LKPTITDMLTRATLCILTTTKKTPWLGGYIMLEITIQLPTDKILPE